MNVSQAQPLVSRSELKAFLQAMPQDNPAKSLAQDAEHVLDGFKAQTGEGLADELTVARVRANVGTTAGVLGGVALAGLGILTGHWVAGIALGALVAGGSVVLGSEREKKLDNFGICLAAATLGKALDGATQEPGPQQAHQAPHVEAEAMPKGWKPEPGPKKETLIDVHPDGTRTLYERDVPPPPRPPETVTIIDMKPDHRGVFVMDSVNEYIVGR